MWGGEDLMVESKRFIANFSQHLPLLLPAPPTPTLFGYLKYLGTFNLNTLHYIYFFQPMETT